MSIRDLGVIMCIVAAFASLDAVAELILVEGGQPQATIVLGAEPSAQATEAAAYLQEYVEKVSGAQLPIRPESEEITGTRILVGRSKTVRNLGVELPAGYSHQMNEEASIIRTVGSDLVLVGNEDWNYRGTVFAVCDFLEEDLGCRWYFPGPYGEVVPKKETIRVGKLDRIERPSFRIRNIWYSGWMPAGDEDNARMRRWFDLNKLNALALSLPGDGSVIQLAPPGQYYESYPAVFAIDKKGEHSKEMLCMTEPEAVRIGAEHIKKTFRADPNRLSYGFAPPDGFPHCYCERCQLNYPGFHGKGYGDPSLSEAWFKFANKIAWEVHKEFPERWVLTNGYSNRVRLPEGITNFAPNLGIQSAIIAACSIHRIGDPRCWQRQAYEGLLERWLADLKVVFIYDYDPAKGLDNLPYPAIHCLKHDIPWFRDRGCWGFYTEGTNSWMVTHLNYYLRAKLMWDADSDVDALVAEYCRSFYGEAAAPIERYIWTLDRAVENTKTHETWGRLMQWRAILPPILKDLDSLMASAVAKADAPETKRRVDVMRLTHEHMKTFLDMEQAAAAGDFVAAVKRANDMVATRPAIEAVQTGLLPPETKLASGQSSSVQARKGTFAFLADRQNGTIGEMVTLLPREWEFKADPKGMGAIKQWYLDGKTTGWKPIDSTFYWEANGYQDDTGWGYWGDAWYKTQFEVPADAAGKDLWLAVSGVYNWGVWVWVNGVMREFEMDRHWRLGYHLETSPFEVNVSDLIKPGESNGIAILVHTREPGRNPRGGLHGRVFLWEKK